MIVALWVSMFRLCVWVGVGGDLHRLVLVLWVAAWVCAFGLGFGADLFGFVCWLQFLALVGWFCCSGLLRFCVLMYFGICCGC